METQNIKKKKVYQRYVSKSASTNKIHLLCKLHSIPKHGSSIFHLKFLTLGYLDCFHFSICRCLLRTPSCICLNYLREGMSPGCSKKTAEVDATGLPLLPLLAPVENYTRKKELESPYFQCALTLFFTLY